jgi:hypothetical protein
VRYGGEAKLRFVGTAARLLGCSMLGLFLSGCPNPNTYATARTTPPGKLSFTVAPEALGWRSEVPAVDESGNRSTEEISGAVPVTPTFQMRLGVADEVDLGFRVNNLASLGFDAKYNFLKGAVDIALDPGIQWYRLSFESSTASGTTSADVNVFYLHGPLLIDLNFHETVSLVLSPGVVYGIASSDADFSGGESDVTRVATSDGVFARFGVGIDFRLSARFALHPEVTVMRNFGDEADLLYMTGLGFNFGNLPSFADQADAEND